MGDVFTHRAKKCTSSLTIPFGLNVMVEMITLQCSLTTRISFPTSAMCSLAAKVFITMYGNWSLICSNSTPKSIICEMNLALDNNCKTTVRSYFNCCIAHIGTLSMVNKLIPHPNVVRNDNLFTNMTSVFRIKIN